MLRTDDFPFQRIPVPLLDWYYANKRDLPWRVNPTPYRVWVSEIMLQQTRVEAARDYYLRFVRELPDTKALADCPDERLMKLWEGLGYYSRARNMKRTARILEAGGGKFPCDEKALRALPGIGEYTAGAILSIAFGKPVPAVDGNVLRVLSRLTENPTEISEPAYKSYLKEKLAAVYPSEGNDCSAFTQALMELGALVCTPRSPSCERCPLRKLCRAYAEGTTERFPVLPEKKKKREETVFVFVIRTPEGIAVRKRERGVLKGMNEFPSEPAGERTTPQEILDGWGMSSFKIVKSRKYSHIFTHIRWEMVCFLVEAESAPFPVYTLEKLDREASLPTAFRQCEEILTVLPTED